jgi:hypothetical protein
MGLRSLKAVRKGKTFCSFCAERLLGAREGYADEWHRLPACYDTINSYKRHRLVSYEKIPASVRATSIDLTR